MNTKISFSFYLLVVCVTVTAAKINYMEDNEEDDLEQALPDIGFNPGNDIPKFNTDAYKKKLEDLMELYKKTVEHIHEGMGGIGVKVMNTTKNIQDTWTEGIQKLKRRRDEL